MKLTDLLIFKLGPVHMVKKRTQICDPLTNKCLSGHDSVLKTSEIYLTRGHFFHSKGHLFEMEGHLFDRKGHLFDRKGHLFWEGSQICYKLLGGRNFDHVYKSLTQITQFSSHSLSPFLRIRLCRQYTENKSKLDPGRLK